MVHKIVVCSQSKVFHTTCSSGFRESSTNTIDLTDDGISLISRMIKCLYHGSYANFHAVDDAENWKSPYQLHAAMYALGDKYDITLLQDTALANFAKLGTKPGDILGFKAGDLVDFIESIPIVYSSTPDSDRKLRDLTLEKIKASPYQFLHEDVKESFQKVVVEVPDFSWDLHRHWMTIAPEPRKTGSSKRKR